jgi:N6-L-threonylcarbamoyladenine synthase
MHSEFGGVVPELASREHQKNILRVVEKAIQDAHIQRNEIDAVAYTKGPGLMGSLLVGSAFAKAFAQSLGVPLLPVNHLQAHIMALFEDGHEAQFPFLCLIVSGGHTLIIDVQSFNQFELIGQTLDDAAGEAFDKVAKLIGLPYPGGPVIDKLAQNGDVHAFSFPIPNVPDYNYSFSGFKTSFLNFIQREVQKNPNFIQERIHDICASVQHSIVEILLDKFIKVIDTKGVKNFSVTGGVAANSYLKKQLNAFAIDRNLKFKYPSLKLCTDNAGMIGLTAWYQSAEKSKKSLELSSAKGGLFA